MTRKITLSINRTPIEIDYFVQNFLDHTVVGMVSSLEGVGDIHELEVLMEGREVKILLNGDSLPVNEFVSDLFSNTLLGLVSTLKGAHDVKHLTIRVQR